MVLDICVCTQCTQCALALVLGRSFIHPRPSTQPPAPPPQAGLLEGGGAGQGGHAAGAGRAERAHRAGGRGRGRDREPEGDHRVPGQGAGGSGPREAEPGGGGVREERGDAAEPGAGVVAAERACGGEGFCQQHGRVDGRRGLHRHQGRARCVWVFVLLCCGTDYACVCVGGLFVGSVVAGWLALCVVLLPACSSSFGAVHP